MKNFSVGVDVVRNGLAGILIIAALSIEAAGPVVASSPGSSELRLASSAGAESSASTERAFAPRGWLEGLRWVNADPISAATIKGRVVVVEFWTFDCINCRRTIPAMKALADAFPDSKDVTIIGVHTPELERERDFGNVRRAVSRLGLRFAVAQDNDYSAWNAFQNQYWPALYVLDRRGAVRYQHVGELHLGTPAWEELQRTIRELRKTRA